MQEEKRVVAFLFLQINYRKIFSGHFTVTKACNWQGFVKVFLASAVYKTSYKTRNEFLHHLSCLKGAFHFCIVSAAVGGSNLLYVGT